MKKNKQRLVSVFILKKIDYYLFIYAKHITFKIGLFVFSLVWITQKKTDIYYHFYNKKTDRRFV
jgi:hypothetical protein